MKRNILSYILVLLLAACSSSGVPEKTGNELRMSDAVIWLAGNNQRAWKLVHGHSTYDYLLFSENEVIVDEHDRSLKYSVAGNQLRITENNRVTTTFLISEISHDSLHMTCIKNNQRSEPLLYINTAIGNKYKYAYSTDQWLKGRFGTVWCNQAANATIAIMNDGRLLDPLTREEKGKWKVGGEKSSREKIFPVEIISSDCIQLQWNDTLLNLYYSGQAANIKTL